MIAVSIIISILFSLVVGIPWGICIERDAQERFAAPRPLPKVTVVRDRQLDIETALKRRQR